MPVRVTCPECGASRDVNEDQRGKKVPCRKCEALIRVPAKRRAADPEEDLELVEEVEAVEEATPVKKKPRRSDEEDDEAIREAAAKKKKAAPPPAKSQKRRDDEDEEEDGAIREAPAKKKAAPPPAKSPKRRDDADEEEERPRGKKGKKTKQRSTGATVAIAAVLIVVIVAGLGAGAYFLLKKDDAFANAPPPVPLPPPMAGLGGPGGPGAANPDLGAAIGGDSGKPAGGGDAGKPKDPPKTDPEPTPVTSAPQISRSTIYNYALKSTAWIITRHLEGGAMGTGSLIDRDNRLVLTNYHVVYGMVDFVVFFPTYDKDNKLILARSDYLARAKREDAVKGKVVAHDKTRDLALIQLDRVPDGVESLPFAKSDPAQGDNVHSIGNPGASGSLWVYTRGMVRSVYPNKWKAGGEDFVLDLKATVVETDSPTNPGDSGGPCVNDRGELVGVTQGGSRGANAIALFIAYSEAEDFIKQAFKAAPVLAGKSWSRSGRPPLVASSGGGAPDAPKLPTLVAKLASPDPIKRGEGAEGLALLGPDAALAIPELVKALSDKDAFVRRSAGRALRQAGQPSAKDFPGLLPDLVPSLESTSPEARVYVLETLALLGGMPQAAQAAPGVLKATDDPDDRVRVQAMRALGRMVGGEAVDEKEATAALEKGLQDADKKVRGAAAESLAVDVPSVKSNVPKLIALLKHKEPEVRVQAAKAIGRLGEKGKPAIPDLLDAVRVDNRELRKAGFVALKSVKATPQELVPVLRGGIKDEDVEVRRAALEAAGEAGPAAKDLVLVIVDALADSDVRIPALSALKKLGPDAREGAPGVANLLTTDRAMRMDTLSTLEAMKLSGPTLTLVIPKLMDVFGDEKQEPVREKVAEVLASIGKPVIQDLCKLLLNPKAEMRAGAATSLGKMGHTAQVASANLQAAIQKEPDDGVKDKEIAALRRINSVPPTKP